MKKLHSTSRQPPTDDQILRRLKRDGVPTLPLRGNFPDAGKRPKAKAQAYPKGCLPEPYKPKKARRKRARVDYQARIDHVEDCRAFVRELASGPGRSSDVSLWLAWLSEVAALGCAAVDSYRNLAERDDDF
jgi:hypothetical protein